MAAQSKPLEKMASGVRKPAVAPRNSAAQTCGMRCATIPLVMLTTLCSSAEAAKGPRVPPDKWAVDYQKDYCLLSRDGFAGEAGVAFRTQPFSNEQGLLFYLPRTGEKERSVRGRVRIGDGQPGAERWIGIGEPPKQLKLIDTTISADELASVARSTSIQVTGQGLDVTVPLPMIEKAMAALDECEIHLAGRWGVAAAEMKEWSKPPRAQGDLRSLFWSEDYSKMAMMTSGGVRAVLEIDENAATRD
jgi:hypothetical protein